jgi:hypothetical protein
MKRYILLAALTFALAVPATMLAQSENHVEVGVFANYLRYEAPTTPTNFVGAGGRIGFFMNPWTSIEAEMAYNFERNVTNTTGNGINTSFSSSGLRPLSALFGPKFQTGRGAFDFFATGKVGFINFNNSTGTAAGFPNAVGNITSGNTRFDLYPGVGIEGFWGPFGLRADVGDEIYFLNGAQHNLKVTFGPHFRF